MTFALFASLCVSAEASECDLYNDYPNGPPLTEFGSGAACLISESIILGQKCERAVFHETRPVEGDFFCDRRNHRRFLQMVHPKFGYLDCLIVHQIDQRIGSENDPKETYQAVSCQSFQFQSEN